MKALLPASETEAAAIISANRGAGLRVTGDTKLDYSGEGAFVSAARITGVTSYEPRDFTVSALAGSHLEEVTALLAENGQQLAFEPPSYGLQTTIGAIAALNASGPRRPFAGAARDALLHARFVSGLGEVVSAGSCVLKSVAGLDLTKLLAGSFGNFAFLTEVTFRVGSVAEAERTLILSFANSADFPAYVSRLICDGVPITGAAHLSPAVSREILPVSSSATAIRLEGTERALAEVAKGIATPKTFVDGAASAAIWRAIGSARTLFPDSHGVLWRITGRPSQGGELAARLAQIGADTLTDWRGGLVWVWHHDVAAAPMVMSAITDTPSAHARLICGPEELAPVRRIKAGEERFERAMKQALDPENTFDARPYFQGFAVGEKP
ncbi:MAG: FAD-binding protein [Hyphomicrobiales bacterium]|nr:FAD-binding protein [Hyphomicrobiales bacterium]